MLYHNGIAILSWGLHIADSGWRLPHCISGLLCCSTH